jgi:hypothetical protein
VNYPMVGGDRLYTGPGSRAVVQLGGAELRIWQASDVTLTNIADNYEQIGLAQGALRLRVFQMEPGSQIEVDTPNGAALINSPGDYRVEAFPQGSNGDQNASSILTVNSGNAQLTGPNINLPVSGGYSIGLFGLNPVQLQYLDVPDYDDLDYWSISLDQRLQNSTSARYVSRQMVGYSDLDANGTWSQDPEFGPVWYPTSVPNGWQPYSTGHWAYVQPWGYTWVDDAPWGFAPFHYGRWSQRGGRWGWFPGPPAVRPVYSPALVAFVGGAPGGGGGISIGISIGGGGGGISAWFPIGVGEPYVPWYRCSPNYARQVNVTNVNVAVIHNTTVVNNYNTYITKTVVNNTTINNTTVNNVTVNNFNYANRAAVIAVPAKAMASGGSVSRQAVALSPQQRQQIAQAPISVRPTAPVPVAAHPSLVPVANVARPAARPALMTPTGQARPAMSVAHPQPVAIAKLPPAAVMPKNPPPPAAVPKPIQQNRVNQPVNAYAGTAVTSAGSTLTKRPCWPRSWKRTTPETLAKRVSSLPRPTLAPGFSGVPRWRTMMPPPRIAWPPKTLTPSRCAFESRPFLDEPKPFLCAIRLPLSRRPSAESSLCALLKYFACFFGLEALAVDQDLVDLDFDEVLAVALHLLVLLLALELEDQDLVAAAFAEHGAGDLGAGQLGLELARFAADARTSENSMAPFSCAVRSIFNVSPGETRYCLPPVRITAYITKFGCRHESLSACNQTHQLQRQTIRVYRGSRPRSIRSSLL